MSTALRHYNRIFSTVRDAVIDRCPNVVRSADSLAETQYPALVLQLIGSPERTDFGRNGMGAEVSYQADVYTVGPGRIAEAAEIMALACEAFKGLGFPPDIREVPVSGKPSMFRLVGRFKTYMGSGDYEGQ